MFVREAYSLLRQSIIHVEQDDIDFDEEELEGERPDDARPRASEQDESQDVDMTGTGDLTSDTLVHQTDESQQGTSQLGAQTDDSMAGQTAVAPEHATPMQPKKKKAKMQITHDQYMTLQSLVVFHLAEHERETGAGIDRDDLVDWYLEMKEEELEDVEALEHEKELFTKVLKKLVKVTFLFLLLIIRRPDCITCDTGSLPHPSGWRYARVVAVGRSGQCTDASG